MRRRAAFPAWLLPAWLLPALLIPALLILAGCQTAEPPRPVVAAARPAPRLPPAPAVEGVWSFAAAGARCTARVTHPDASLSVAAGPGPLLALTVPSTRRGSQIAFSGPDGNWRLPARAGEGGLQATQPLTPAAEARLRALLGGGTVSIPGARQPPLRLPGAGVSGREWFGCLERLRQG